MAYKSPASPLTQRKEFEGMSEQNVFGIHVWTRQLARAMAGKRTHPHRLELPYV